MPTFIHGNTAYSNWADSLHEGRAPVLYEVGDPNWNGIEVGPGNIVLFGGAPGAGKTALVTQLTTEALLRTPELHAVVASVEMSPSTLLDRQLSRLSGVPATDIRFRRVGFGQPKVSVAMEKLARAAERIAFLQAPFDLSNVADCADAFGADLLVLDYIQRFTGPGEFGSLRESMGAMMSRLREMAELGAAIVVVSAVARGRGDHGATYDRESLGLASFRESSELEYGADSAWMLAPGPSGMHLSCLKNRHGETPELLLNFDRARQSFEIAPQLFPLSMRPELLERPRRPSRAELRAGAALACDRQGQPVAVSEGVDDL